MSPWGPDLEKKKKKKKLYFNYFNKTWVICIFFKLKQSTCQILNMAVFLREIGEGNVFVHVVVIVKYVYIHVTVIYLCFNSEFLVQ